MPKRFYREVTVGPVAGGHAPHLDGRLPKTPGKAVLAAPTAALAQVLAAEWDSQIDWIDHTTMPAVRLAFTAIDRIGQLREATAEEVARFGGSDVICYFADGPADLAEAEAEAWRPWIAWAASDLGVALTPVHGVIHQPQSHEALERIRQLALAENDFVLAGLAFGAALYGSAILTFAVWRGALHAVEAFEISRFDEAFQARRWGLDEEAERRREAMEREAAMLGRWFDALRDGR